jgi:hypothetical protein
VIFRVQQLNNQESASAGAWNIQKAISNNFIVIDVDRYRASPEGGARAGLHLFLP